MVIAVSIELDQGALSFYGNAAGFVEQGRIIVDPIFRSGELEAFLEKQGLPVEWRPGVFQRLAFGWEPEAEPIKRCRIWQLRPTVDPRLRFAAYKRLDGHEPNPADYQLAYEGCFNTNDPEAIYTACQQQLPEGYLGHPLTISDVVELYDDNGSRFYYADKAGFQVIAFNQ